MGMFDWINFKMACPECGSEVDGFQSKDGGCYLTTVEPDSVNNFYSSCNCGHWIEFVRNQPKEKPSREISLTLDEVTALGFTYTLTKE